jgi:hypothetical protein
MRTLAVLTFLLLSAPAAFAQRDPFGKVGTFRFVEERGATKLASFSEPGLLTARNTKSPTASGWI